MSREEGDSLATRLAASLPATEHAFKYHHISTPPNLCPALYASPPGCKPDKTYCESHFLLVSVPAGQGSHKGDVAVFAVEALIYTTATLTTLFVPKADSTGLARHANRLPSGASASRVFTSTFIAHLVAHRHRRDRKLVVSLFARAQSQYLFPGSIEHGKKHVLDDRQLVRWWCKTLDPMLHEYAEENEASRSGQGQDIRSKAYLIVPGHDKYETAGFYPQSARKGNTGSRRWVNGHPLQRLSPYPTAAPRCLVPHFPDDPKSRFLDDLDQELPDMPSSQTSELESPSKWGTGQWKSVKTLDQFWDMMAFRQECSSGRLVGFLWIVFRPEAANAGPAVGLAPESPSLRPRIASSKSTSSSKSSPHRQTPLDRRKPPRYGRSRSGLIVSRPPRVKSGSATTLSNDSQPEKTKYYYWPKRSRGNLVLSQKEYARAMELLLRLDFSNIEVAEASTGKWAHEVSVMGGHPLGDWGMTVKSTNYGSGADTESNGADTAIHTVQTKRKHDDGPGQSEHPIIKEPTTTNCFNTLDVSLVRKKIKTTDTGRQPSLPPSEPNVNMLGASLLKKKAKR